MMISPADWHRMSWHARQKYMNRHRMRPVETKSEPITVDIVDSFNQGIVRRCNQCGAWMIDVCNTDHGDRYEP